ncbi:MAG: DUF885 domain-containing protein [Streptosporangiales bacterium]
MSDTASGGEVVAGRSMRDLADGYVDALAGLDPQLATMLGWRRYQDQLADLSPEGQQAKDALARSTLAELAMLDRRTDRLEGDDRRCARLLRERLETGLAVSAAGEHLRLVRNILGPVQVVQTVFNLMPTASEDDWAVVARRMGQVPEALQGYAASLQEGARRDLFAAPRQVRVAVDQLDEWIAAGEGAGWFAEFTSTAAVSPALRTELDRAAAAAIAAVGELRNWLAREYLPRAEGTADAVGAERYRLFARQWTGADLDLAEAYDWGWQQFREITGEMMQEAQRVLPGASIREAIAHLDRHGAAVEGVQAVRERLQQLTDRAMADLDGRHFTLTPPMRVCEARIAPPGAAAAPYYTRPSQDFTRPGRTWLPTLGRTRFPLWTLVSTWYHESVPGHHLQHAQWTALAERLSLFQTSVGRVSANTEGWALYAERLMDELGYLSDPGDRLGYLDSQRMRAIRVIIDIGMHLQLPIPSDAPVGAGETWTPDLAREFFASNSGRGDAFVDSEIVRYLGAPGQAISYKLGERAWLTAREASRSAHGDAFDLTEWHNTALSLGCLGLDDLVTELGQL